MCAAAPGLSPTSMRFYVMRMQNTFVRRPNTCIQPTPLPGPQDRAVFEASFPDLPMSLSQGRG